MKLITLLSEIEQAFEKAQLFFGHGTDNAWDEAVQIACFVLKLPPNPGKEAGEQLLSETALKSIRRLAQERIETRQPLPYLTHQAWFMGMPFYVDKRVIVPRSPFGELIANHFSPFLDGKTPKRILDVCTGSGCMAIACSSVFEQAQVEGVDISEAALAVAEKNQAQYPKLAPRLRFYASDLLSSCEGKYDLIISNPPYVDKLAMDQLPAEYQQEPALALFGGEDGLDLVHRLIRLAPRYLEEQGYLFVELGDAEEAFVQAYPDLPVIWLSFERGGSGVFAVSAKALTDYFGRM